MSRVNSKIQKRFDGKRVYTSNSLPLVPISENDIYIYSNDTTRLDSLAYEYYKNASLWWIIARANNLGFGYAVRPGLQIRIPTNIQPFI